MCTAYARSSLLAPTPPSAPKRARALAYIEGGEGADDEDHALAPEHVQIGTFGCHVPTHNKGPVVRAHKGASVHIQQQMSTHSPMGHEA